MAPKGGRSMKRVLWVITAILLLIPSVANAQITKDQYYARSTLSGNELEYYDAIYEYIDGTGGKVYKSDYGIGEDEYERYWYYVYNDSPELFMVYGEYTSEEIETLNAELEIKADEVISTIPNGASDYEKFNVIGRYIVDNVVYGMSTEGQTIVDALINENAVCAGLCRSLQYLLYKVDIPCYCVFEGTDHMVNIIQIDGEWYWFDITAYTQYQFDETTYKPTAKMLPLKDDTFKTTHTTS